MGFIQSKIPLTCALSKRRKSSARMQWNHLYWPVSSTTNSNMVSWLPSCMSGKGSLPCFTINCSILERSSNSSNAPTPHIRANTNRRLRWLALRTPCSSLLGIRPCRRSRHCKRNVMVVDVYQATHYRTCTCTQNINTDEQVSALLPICDQLVGMLCRYGITKSSVTVPFL